MVKSPEPMNLNFDEELIDVMTDPTGPKTCNLLSVLSTLAEIDTQEGQEECSPSNLSNIMDTPLEPPKDFVK